MSEYRHLARGDVFPASFLKALQEFIGSTYSNYQLTLANATTVQVVAGPNSAQVGMGIDGLWRYNSATVNHAVTGGAGSYDVFATCGPNVFTDTPSPDTDLTVYSFALQVLATGSTPTTNPSGPVSNYRKIGQLQWSGSAITGLSSLDGNGDPTGTWQSGDLKLSAALACPGFLLCDGTAVSQTTYASLYAAIGSLYNTGGEGSGNFRLPDYRGRTILGSGTGTGLTNRPLGSTGGVETQTLSTANMPSHDHGGLTGGMDANESHTHTEGPHHHDEYNPPINPGFAGWSVLEGVSASGSGDPKVPYNNNFAGGSAFTTGDTTPTINAVNLAHEHGISAEGSGTAHNNMQPYGTANVFIKT